MSLPCNFGLLSGSSLCFIVWNPFAKKTLNPTKRFQPKKHADCFYPNPPAGPLRRFDLLQTF